MATNNDFYWTGSCYTKTPTFKHPHESELIKDADRLMLIQKFLDWALAEEELLRTEIQPRLDAINAMKDETDRRCAFEALKASEASKKLLEARNHKKRLGRLEILSRPPSKESKAIEKFEFKKQVAKDTPIISLYNFQKLRKIGKKYIACCPLHNEKTPSFHIYGDNRFYCFGCHKSGDAIDFYRELNGVDFKQAVACLAGAA